jgi:hypothetical protein
MEEHARTTHFLHMDLQAYFLRRRIDASNELNPGEGGVMIIPDLFADLQTHFFRRWWFQLRPPQLDYTFVPFDLQYDCNPNEPPMTSEDDEYNSLHSSMPGLEEGPEVVD